MIDPGYPLEGTHKLRNDDDINSGLSLDYRRLRDHQRKFDSDMALAVAAYNAGENNVIKYGHEVPPFAETRNYVTKVLAYYNHYN